MRTSISASIRVCSLLLFTSLAGWAGNADPWLNRARGTYHACRTYRDTGVIETRFGPGRSTLRKSFTTSFRRGGALEFHFQGAFGSDGFTAADPARARTEAQRLTGVSESASFTVPSLLWPEMFGYDVLSVVRDWQVAGRETLDGRDCIRLQGSMPAMRTAITLWLDARTGQVRRTRRILHHPPETPVETLTTYQIP